MIRSMTAFARVQHQSEWGSIVVEMRSINHRYLDVNVSLPDTLRHIDLSIRHRLRERVKRGKIECVIRYQAQPPSHQLFTVNTLLAQALCQSSEQVAAFLPTATPVCALDILKWPGVLEVKEEEMQALQASIIALVEEATEALLQMRGREGEQLKQLLLQRLDGLSEQLSIIRQHGPQVIVAQQERLKKRFIDAEVELDSARLEQEMVLFAQKIDVAEEIERIDMHIEECRRVMMSEDAIGRRLDFLLQELNREANTLGAKSVDPVMTHRAVEMKVLIEQMREQVQNIE
jgi:uncharacterized protein (TIGR00255 family)